MSLAQSGTVTSHQKISSTSGGFGGALDASDYFYAVTALGDLDGDGTVDLAVGANGDDDGGTDRGAVWIVFMNTDGTVKGQQKISDTQGGFPAGSLSNTDVFGCSVASLGDLDGDGKPDLAVGAYYDDDGGPDRGAVWVLFLNADGTVKAYQKISDTQGGFTGVLDDNDVFGISIGALGDLDGDGKTDLGVRAYDDDGGAERGAVWVLFLNADGTVKGHQKISATSGGFTGTLESNDYFGGSVASLGDLDGDGASDLAAGAIYDDDGDTDRGAVYVLFLNRADFADAANVAGVADTGNGQGAAWGDYDGDGDLDLYLSKYGAANRLYRNDGDGTFTDVGGTTADAANGYGVVWGDCDNDGDLDLYLVNNSTANRLYRNDGGGTFAEVGSGAGVADAGTGRTAGWGDYDLDGDLDLYVCNAGEANKLYRNDGGMSFASVGGATADAGQGFGMAWGDYDDDGDLDLYLANASPGADNRLY